MYHRKEEHRDIVKVCRHFTAGSCDFDENVCWFLHEYQETHGKNPSASSNFNCKYCGNLFQSKSDLMFHRKAEHFQVVKQCRNYESGYCSYNDKECWYKHNESSYDNQANKPEQHSVFQQVQRNPPPDDDIMARVVGMMEKIMTEFAILKKESKKHQ